jgi:hypothetical protein
VAPVRLERLAAADRPAALARPEPAVLAVAVVPAEPQERLEPAGRLALPARVVRLEHRAPPVPRVRADRPVGRDLRAPQEELVRRARQARAGPLERLEELVQQEPLGPLERRVPLARAARQDHRECRAPPERVEARVPLECPARQARRDRRARRVPREARELLVSQVRPAQADLLEGLELLAVPAQQDPAERVVPAAPRVPAE